MQANALIGESSRPAIKIALKAARTRLVAVMNGNMVAITAQNLLVIGFLSWQSSSCAFVRVCQSRMHIF